MELYFGLVVGTRMPCVRGKGWEAQLLWRPGGFEIQMWGSLNRKSETWWKSNFSKKVCPSCRAFFRRSVQSGYNATYFCIKVCQSWVVADRVSVIFHIKDGNCEVTLKTRKNCQYCRYKWVAIFMPTHSLESMLEATSTFSEIILRLFEFLTEYLRQNAHGRIMYSPQTCWVGWIHWEHEVNLELGQ